ncbi:Folate gamma-glutamyl hydrolase, partial [Durusdinium trenchii]
KGRDGKGRDDRDGRDGRYSYEDRHGGGYDRRDDDRRRSPAEDPPRRPENRERAAGRGDRGRADSKDRAGDRQDRGEPRDNRDVGQRNDRRDPVPDRGRSDHRSGPPGDGRRHDRSRSRHAPEERAVRVAISNLPHDMDEGELKDTASAYGKVLGLRLHDGGPKQPKKGWVEYSSRREAEYAVSELDHRSMAEWDLLLRASIEPQAVSNHSQNFTKFRGLHMIITFAFFCKFNLFDRLIEILRRVAT